MFYFPVYRVVNAAIPWIHEKINSHNQLVISLFTLFDENNMNVLIMISKS